MIREHDRRLTEAEARNRDIAEHVRLLRDHLAHEREELERIRSSIADNRHHIETTQRFLRGDD